MAKITKQDAKTSELVKIANERTGEILKVISPHDFIIGIEQHMQSDLRVIGSSYITGSLHVKGGAKGVLKLPDGTPAIKAGTDIQIVDNGDGGYTINSLSSGGSGIALAPKNAPFLTYQSSGDLSNEKVLSATGPITFNSSTAKIGFDSTASLTVAALSTNALTINGENVATIPFILSTTNASLPGAKIMGAGSGINISTAGSSTTIAVDSSVVRTSGAIFSGQISAPDIYSTNSYTTTLNSTNIDTQNIISSKIISQQITGSITKLSNGSPYLNAGTNVTIATGSDGSITISAPAASGAPLDAKYLLLDSSNSGLLANERLLALGSGLVGTDAGSGNSYTIKVSDSHVAFLTGAIFTGDVSAPIISATNVIKSPAFSGSLTRLSNGNPYLRAGNHVFISTGTDGSITIAAETGSFTSGPFITFRHDSNFPGSLSLIEGDGIQFDEDHDPGCRNLTISAKLKAGPGIAIETKPTREILISSNVGTTFLSGTFILASASQGFPNARTLTSSSGIQIIDNGPGGKYNFSIDKNQIPFLTGANFSGPVTFSTGLSGSLTRLIDGSPFLIAGQGIDISTGSNGSITISNVGPAGDITEVIAGNGLIGGGTSGPISLSIDVASIPFLTGAQFTGAVTFAGGLTGSLTQLSDGSAFLRAGEGITLSTGSDGSVTISSHVTGTTPGTLSGPIITYESSSIQNSRRAKQGTGILITTSSIGEVVFSVDSQVGGASAYLSKLALNEQLTGEIDGSNRLFEISKTPSDSSQLMIWLNGQLLTCGAGYDYTTTGTSVMFTSGSTPQVDDTIAVMYPYVETSSRYILNERVNVTVVDGVITGELQYEPIESKRLLFFWNGQLLSQGSSKDYTIVGKKIYINASLEELDPDDIFIATYMAYSGTAYYEVNEEITINYNSSTGFWVAELSHEPAPASTLMLFMNGQLLKRGAGEDFISDSNNIVILDDEISDDFRFYATYQYS